MKATIYFFLFGILLSQSCSPKYFTSEIDNFEIWDYCELPANFDRDTSRYKKYELELEPVYIFQNDQITHALLSKNSSVFDPDGANLLRIDAGEAVLNRDTNHHYSNSWHKFIAWVPKDISENDTNHVMLESISGKSFAGKDKIKSVTLFLGQKEKNDGQISGNLDHYSFYQMTKVYKNVFSKVKAKHRRKKEFLSILTRNSTYGNKMGIEVVAVIDKGYKTGKNHMSVYELDYIFGENLFLVKK